MNLCKRMPANGKIGPDLADTFSLCAGELRGLFICSFLVSGPTVNVGTSPSIDENSLAISKV